MALFKKRCPSSLKILLAILLLGLNTAYASENDDFFNKIKVAFTYRLIQFVDLTDNQNNSPITLCVLAGSQTNQVFADFEEKEISGQNISVLFLNQIPKSSDQCNVLYISHAEQAQWPHILKQIAPLGKLLTVSDIDQFAKLGGMVELKIHDQNIKIEINISNAKNIGLRFSSKLLEVAKIVEKN